MKDRIVFTCEEFLETIKNTNDTKVCIVFDETKEGMASYAYKFAKEIKWT
jgi:hypothetical protein